jgi:sarcosine oxidase, subunit gamma
VARSPVTPVPPHAEVAGWAVSGRRSTADLTVTDHTPLAKVTVKAPVGGGMAAFLGVGLGRAARRSWASPGDGIDVLLVGSGPGEWLVLAAPGRQGPLVDRLQASTADLDELVTVIDTTHARALVRLTGARSRELLAKECGIDLTDAICPDGSALRSAVAGVATDLVRDDLGEVRSYLLHCERSSGQYLFDALLDAGADLGVDVDGFRDPAV